MVKNWSKMSFLPVSANFSNSYRPMSTISGRYIPKTSLICNIERIQPNHTSKRSKKVKNRSKMAFFHVFRPFQTISRKVIGRRRLYLVDISQIHLRSVIYNELNQNSKTSGYGASEKSDCVEKTRF